MEISDLCFDTREILPPLSNGMKYAAKVQVLFVKDSRGRRKIDQVFSESWGRTKSEAEEKMEATVKAWLASQQGKV